MFQGREGPHQGLGHSPTTTEVRCLFFDPKSPRYPGRSSAGHAPGPTSWGRHVEDVGARAASRPRSGVEGGHRSWGVVFVGLTCRL